MFSRLLIATRLRSSLLTIEFCIVVPLLTGCGAQSSPPAAPNPASQPPQASTAAAVPPAKASAVVPTQPTPVTIARSAAELEALAIIQQLGGKFEEDLNLLSKPVIAVDLRGTKLSEDGLARLKGLPHLKKLQLGGNQITNAGLVHVAHLSKLESLSVNDGGGSITSAGFVHLAGLKSLKTLSVGPWSEVSGEGLKNLPTSLEELGLSYSSADDKALEQIAKFTNLQKLYLHRSPITDAGVAHLKALTKLNYLSLYETKVTDKALQELRELKNLKKLELNGVSTVTEAGIAAFKAALPNCEIVR